MNTHTEFSEDANKENVIQPKKKWNRHLINVLKTM